VHQKAEEDKQEDGYDKDDGSRHHVDLTDGDDPPIMATAIYASGIGAHGDDDNDWNDGS
jgi:hypothetical protein